MGGAVQRCEGFEPVERAAFLEDMGQAGQRDGRREAARAAAGGFLGAVGMGRAVGAQEEAGMATGRRVDERLAMHLPLGDGQAVIMRTDAAGEDVVAVYDQVMRRDRPANAGLLHEMDAIGGGDMFERDLQFRQPAAERLQHPLDEHRFPVEDVDGRVGHLAMDAERHPGPRHGLQDGHHRLDIAHAACGVRCGSGGIELYRRNQPVGMGRDDVIGLARFGQVERHQRHEIAACRHGGQDPVPIGGGVARRDHGRDEVRHDDRPPGPERMGQHGLQHRAIAQMKMPVIGASQGEGRRHADRPTGMASLRQAQADQRRRAAQLRPLQR